ncbi:MAG: hypothetical protein EHM67_07340, partial [Hyphomicrobiaceae bacterium]
MPTLAARRGRDGLASQKGCRKAQVSVDPLSNTPLLDQVVTPADLRRLSEKQLRQLANELRQETIDAV